MRILTITLLLGLIAAQTPPLKTIEEIQTPKNLNATTPNDTSVLHGQVVRVRGVVMTECSWHGQFNLSTTPPTYRCSIWLQDSARSGPRTGLQIRRQNISDKPTGFTNLQRGQYVELRGTVSYFRGEIQLTIDTLTAPIILNPSVPIARPVTITPDSVNQPSGLLHDVPKGDKWQGSFVKMENLRVITVQTNPLRITAQDSRGNQVLIFGEFKGLTNSFPVNTFLDSVKGIILHFWPSSGTPTYEICPWHDSLVYVGNPVPIVSNLTRSPVCPNSSNAVTVQVNASSNSPSDSITAVRLFYAIGSSTSYTMVPMTRVGSTSTYEATIPPQPQGTFVHYFVRAYDQTNDSVRVPRFEPQAYRVNNAGCRITDIQYVIPSVSYAYNPSARRDYLGCGYTGLQVTDVPGIVTASQHSNDTSLGYVYIQQPGATQWAGIWVRGNGLDVLRVGDSVVVTSATVDEYFGLTNLNNASVNRIGPAQSVIQPVVLPLNVVFGDTQYAATEPYESMLIRFRHDNPTQRLFVVAPKLPSAPAVHQGDYRVGMDPNDPAKGIRVLAGRQTSSIFSSLNVSYVNDSAWASQDGLINPAIPLCIVQDTTRMDSLQGILTYQWNFVKLLPRNNKDFWNVQGTLCRTQQVPSALLSGQAANAIAWPNPFSAGFDLYTPESWGMVEAHLLSSTGQRLHTRYVQGASTWHASDLPQGLYFLQVHSPQGLITLRLVRL
jgi:hypothetical protein